MKCCSSVTCRAFESSFDASYAEGDLKAYRKKGPAKATRVLIQTIQSLVDVRDASLLDIGGGVGAIQHELLKAGLRSAVDVDGSSAFIAAAKEEDERQGHADRTAYLHGDFVALADQVESADIVTLDRVICCYPDMPKLVGLSAARTHKVYGLVFPRDTWWMRVGAWFVNIWERLNRDPLLFYVHAAPDVDATAAQHGLRLYTHRNIGWWQVRVYLRASF